jgi:hypothetical protein
LDYVPEFAIFKVHFGLDTVARVGGERDRSEERMGRRNVFVLGDGGFRFGCIKFGECAEYDVSEDFGFALGVWNEFFSACWSLGDLRFERGSR